MAEEDTIHQEDNGSRALDKPREFPVAAAGYYAYQEEEIHLRDYLNVIMRRKWIVITFFVAVVATVVIATYLMRSWSTRSNRISEERDRPSSMIILLSEDLLRG